MRETRLASLALQGEGAHGAFTWNTFLLFKTRQFSPSRSSKDITVGSGTGMWMVGIFSTDVPAARISAVTLKDRDWPFSALTRSSYSLTPMSSFEPP